MRPANEEELFVALRELFKRANVFGYACIDSNFKGGFGGHIERLARPILFPFILARLAHAAFSSCDVHAFCGIGVELETARVNQAKRLFAAVGKPQRVAYNSSLKIDIRFTDGGNAC